MLSLLVFHAFGFLAACHAIVCTGTFRSTVFTNDTTITVTYNCSSATVLFQGQPAVSCYIYSYQDCGVCNFAPNQTCGTRYFNYGNSGSGIIGYSWPVGDMTLALIPGLPGTYYWFCSDMFTTAHSSYIGAFQVIDPLNAPNAIKPVNDECTGAVQLTVFGPAGNNHFSNVNATGYAATNSYSNYDLSRPVDPIRTSCASGGATNRHCGSLDVWFWFVAPCTGNMTVAIVGDVDVVAGHLPGSSCAVVTSSLFPDSTSGLDGCVDNFYDNTTETLTFLVASGERHYLTVGSSSNTPNSQISITLSCVSPTSAPSQAPSHAPSQPLSAAPTAPMATSQASNQACFLVLPFFVLAATLA
jgi:hypothetical protein